MKQITVLLADDNGVVRSERVTVLRSPWPKKLRPALILMDLTMPLLNGLQATRPIVEVVPLLRTQIRPLSPKCSYYQRTAMRRIS
jgi:chemotaxis response regulator CheB